MLAQRRILHRGEGEVMTKQTSGEAGPLRRNWEPAFLNVTIQIFRGRAGLCPVLSWSRCTEGLGKEARSRTGWLAVFSFLKNSQCREAHDFYSGQEEYTNSKQFPQSRSIGTVRNLPFPASVRPPAERVHMLCTDSIETVTSHQTT